MNFLKNIVVNLKATGPAAVLIVWIMAIVVLGLYGNGELAQRAMTALFFAGGVLLSSFAQKA